jgi:hypothetical protein
VGAEESRLVADGAEGMPARADRRHADAGRRAAPSGRTCLPGAAVIASEISARWLLQETSCAATPASTMRAAKAAFASWIALVWRAMAMPCRTARSTRAGSAGWIVGSPSEKVIERIPTTATSSILRS